MNGKIVEWKWNIDEEMILGISFISNELKAKICNIWNQTKVILHNLKELFIQDFGCKHAKDKDRWMKNSEKSYS